jgi:hypothetical protein
MACPLIIHSLTGCCCLLVQVSQVGAIQLLSSVQVTSLLVELGLERKKQREIQASKQKLKVDNSTF